MKFTTTPGSGVANSSFTATAKDWEVPTVYGDGAAAESVIGAGGGSKFTVAVPNVAPVVWLVAVTAIDCGDETVEGAV